MTSLPRIFLERYLEVAPISLAIVRSEEAALFSQQTLVRPILDIGSGDGLFASVVFPHSIDVGLDISLSETAMAKPRNCYDTFVIASADGIPFPDNHFSTVISNCVFEHIPSFYESFREIHRVLKPGGRFIFTCHSDKYDDYLLMPACLERFGLTTLRDTYLAAVNHIFKHYNCFSAEKWGGFLTKAGFSSYEHQYYLPKANLQRFDLLLPLALPAMLNKMTLGYWIHLPKPWLARSFGDMIQPDSSGLVETGGALYFIAYKE